MAYEAADQVVQLYTLWLEEYYWITVWLMFLIHLGFMTYEVGSSRRKNVASTLMKNLMLWPVVIVTMYIFGWYIYGGWGFWNGYNEPFGFWPGLFKGLGDPVFPPYTVNDFVAWSPTLAPNLQDRFNGIFWAAFVLFSLTTASIVSGAVIERVRLGAFLILAAVVGSFSWMVIAAWGWSPVGWAVPVLGVHDAYASGAVHLVAGFFALAVLRQLGPRIGKFDEKGRPREIPIHNQWLVTLGLFMIFIGFWGFYAACNVPGLVGVTEGYWGAVNIFGNPTTLTAISMNFLTSLAGGFFGGFLVSRGNPFWTFSGGLAGVIGASSGNDLYHPLQALLVGFFTTVAIYKLHYWVERKYKIDDVVGAVAVHGYAGFLGLLWAGFLLWGTPSGVGGFQGITTPWGQFIWAIISGPIIGYGTGYVVAKILKIAGKLRVPPEVEVIGLDTANRSWGDQYPYFQQGALPEVELVQYGAGATLRRPRSQADGGKIDPSAVSRETTWADIEWNKKLLEHKSMSTREDGNKKNVTQALEDRVKTLETELKNLKKKLGETPGSPTSGGEK